jgi:hypothetical protein
MTDMENELDLRERFARLRGEDHALTPSYHMTVAALAQRRRRRPRWAIRLAAAAAAVVAITVAHQYRQAAVRRERTLAEARHRLLARPGWTAPTDFLLNTPGSRLLRTVPSFGSERWIRTSSTNLGTRNPS